MAVKARPMEYGEECCRFRAPVGVARAVAMAPNSNDTDPMGRPPLEDDEQDGERSDEDTTSAPVVADDRNATDPDPRPVIDWEPPTDNPRIRAIFENMKIRPAPPPVESPITNGEPAAAYASGVARPAPAPNPTPPPQPPVIIAPTPVPEPRQLPARRRADAPTVRIDRPIQPLRGAMVILLALAGCLVVGVVCFAFELLRGPRAAPAPSAVVATATPPAPSLSPPVPRTVVQPPPPISASVVAVPPPQASTPKLTATAKPAAPKTTTRPSATSNDPSQELLKE